MSINCDVGIIILNYNTHKYTIECVESVNSNTSNSIDYEIIVIDNGSKDEDFELLKNGLSPYNLSIKRSNINLGFSGGLQLGIDQLIAKYYFFLNNDTILQNDALSIFCKFYSENVNAGIIGGQILDADLDTQRSFNYLPTIGIKLLGHGFWNLLSETKYPSRSKSYDVPIAVPVISGCAMFVSSENLNQIGGLDLNYFLYCEEEDLAVRMNKSGFVNYYIPKAKYIHHVGVSTIIGSIERKTIFFKSLRYFYFKNFGKSYDKMMVSILTIKFLGKSIRNKVYFQVLKNILAQSPRLTTSIYNSKKKDIDTIVIKNKMRA
jgi:GT2 family glycosyltransferase